MTENIQRINQILTNRRVLLQPLLDETISQKLEARVCNDYQQYTRETHTLSNRAWL